MPVLGVGAASAPELVFVTVTQQVGDALGGGLIVQILSLFTLDKADEEAFLQAWASDAEFMKLAPGFISTQLHRALGDSPTYLNYAVWESTEAFRGAFSHPQFLAKLAAYPASAKAQPHLFQKVAVPGICVA